MKAFFYFIAIFYCPFIFCQKYYPTNFDLAFKWEGYIPYGTDGIDQETFRQFVAKQITKFNHIFGPYHNFTYIENSVDLYRFDRFIEFRQSNSFECGKIFEFNAKGSYIYLSINPDDCGENEAMGFILTALGFQNHIRRIDRDNFVILLWDNIGPVHKSQLYKDYEMYNSTDPIFETFDLDSIMLMSAYSPEAVDPSKPIMIPVENNESNVNKLNLHESDRNVTELDIKQYQSIYHK